MSANGTDGQTMPDLAAIFEDIPKPMAIFDLAGTMLNINRAFERTWGLQRADVVGMLNAFQDPQAVAQNFPDIFRRVAQGEKVISPPLRFETNQSAPDKPETPFIWVEITFFPLHNQTGNITHIALIQHNVTSEMMQREATETAQREIAAQRETIAALSSPVVKIWEGILTMPLIGIIDARRATMITENLLEAIVHHQAERVIIDITGVAMVDTQVANYLLGAARACRLLGSEVALVGIGSEIAQTIVHLGVDLSDIVTLSNLQAGLSWAFQQQNIVVYTASDQQHVRAGHPTR